MTDSKKPFHVVIIGGGIGGLTLAQGLKKNGISCAVYEKDQSRADRLQGYRIFLRDFGTQGLKTCLPDDVYDLVKATAGEKGEGMFSMKTEQLYPLMGFKFKSQGDFFAVSRIVFHRLLSKGIEDLIHYGYRFEKLETLDSGRVRVHFANGQSTEGDFVVGADGVKSAVRTHVLGNSFEPYTFGVDGIVGKVFLEDFEKPLAGVEFIRKGICMVTGTNGRAMFLAPQIYSQTSKIEINKLFAGVDGVTHEAQLRPNAAGGDLLLQGTGSKIALVDDARDYVFWAYLTAHPDEDVPTKSKEGLSTGTSQTELVDVVLKQMQTSSWASPLIDLVMKTDVNTVGYWPLRISPPVKDLSSLKPFNLTFVGDSIHAMPPTGGEGGNTALRDAGKLLDCLVKVTQSGDRETALKIELPKYEEDMLGFSRDSVNRSYRNARLVLTEGYVVPYLKRAVMRIVNFFFGTKEQ